MGIINVPDTLFSQIADLDRRLRIQEQTAKVGLDRLQFCQATASAAPAVYGTNEYGAAGTAWLDSRGNTGTGYPTLDIVVSGDSARNLVIIGYRPADLATGATYRSNSVQVNLRVGAVSGFLNRQFYQANGAQTDAALVSTGIVNLAAGTTTLTIGAAWVDVNPAAANLPLLSDAYLLVLPLN